MPVDSLDKLQTMFKEWRRSKQYHTERIPAMLLKRAQRAAKVYSIQRVVEATGVYRARLKGAARTVPVADAKTEIMMPTFSRIEVAAPVGGRLPLAEAESVTGVKLRIFFSSAEAMGLLSSFCENGGAK